MQEVLSCPEQFKEKDSGSFKQSACSKTGAKGDQLCNGKVLLHTEDKQESCLSSLNLYLLIFGLCLGSFTVALDNTIIATAIPHITTDFNSLSDVGWYGSVYFLGVTALQPAFGRVYTFFNVKYVYLSALVAFGIGSVLCATAGNSAMFISGRTVAGAGEAALYSGGEFSWLLSNVPKFVL